MKKYVLASSALHARLLDEAREWAMEAGYTNFELGDAYSAVAEYNANKEGFTIHKQKASYPKGEKDV